MLSETITEKTVISRNSAVLTSEIDGEILMMNIEHGRYSSLNNIGSDIWRRIDPPCTFADLVERLVGDYDADHATVAKDVRALLTRMLERDVIRLAQ